MTDRRSLVDERRRRQLWQAAVASARNDGAAPRLADDEERTYFEGLRERIAADPDRDWPFDDER
jgi:hypothetical protein